MTSTSHGNNSQAHCIQLHLDEMIPLCSSRISLEFTDKPPQCRDHISPRNFLAAFDETLDLLSLSGNNGKWSEKRKCSGQEGVRSSSLICFQQRNEKVTVPLKEAFC